MYLCICVNVPNTHTPTKVFQMPTWLNQIKKKLEILNHIIGTHIEFICEVNVIIFYIPLENCNDIKCQAKI